MAEQKRLTDQEIRDIVAGMRMADDDKQTLIKQCLDNNPSARFVVYGHWSRKNND